MGVRAEFVDVGKRYAETVALQEFTLTVDAGELATVLGPSGCGKSTLLRLTAGLETLSEGTIRLAGRRIDTLPPPDRDVAMVFQSYALYPHMTVRENVEFPLRMRRVPTAERRRQTAEVAGLLEIEELLDRRPAKLSGGQRQRVALARALVRHPALFLLDEPLSNLDARLRLSVRQHIRTVQRRLGVTTLYVTHDQTEAMTLGDRIVVIERGQIQQVGTPLEVYEYPANVFVAGFIGMPPMNLVPAHHAGKDLTIADQTLTVPSALCERLAAAGSPLTVGVRPEAFQPDTHRSDDALAATIDTTTRENLGSETLVRARLGSHHVVVRLFGHAGVLPNRVVAPIEKLHFFCGQRGARVA